MKPCLCYNIIILRLLARLFRNLIHFIIVIIVVRLLHPTIGTTSHFLLWRHLVYRSPIKSRR